MRKPWHCDHEQNELRRRDLPAGIVQVARQCLNCGAPVGKWLKHETVRNIANLPAWDRECSELWKARERQYMGEYREAMAKTAGVAIYAERSVELNQRSNRKFWERYDEYLSSPQWRSRRAKVLERAGGICEGCREREATQVHHLNYQRIGREMLFDLVAVCEACHEGIHGHV